MSVAISVIISMIIFWAYGPHTFELAMTWFVAAFILGESWSKIRTGTTITGNFYRWADHKRSIGEGWKVYLAASPILFLGIFFFGHLVFGW